jgi:hypothetical protein
MIQASLEKTTLLHRADVFPPLSCLRTLVLTTFIRMQESNTLRNKALPSIAPQLESRS